MTSPFGPNVIPLPRRHVPGRRRIILGVLAIAFVILIVLPWSAGAITDALWYREIGFQSVFFASLEWQSGLFLVRTLVAFGFLFANFRLASPHVSGGRSILVSDGRGSVIDISPMLRWIVPLAALFLALMVGGASTSDWLTWLRGIHGVNTGVTDPLFGRDIGFYLFRLPVLSSVLDTLLALTVLSLIGTGVLYVARGELVPVPRRVSASPGASRHVAALLALMFVILAVSLWWVGTSELLTSDSAPFVGAKFTDVHARLPGIRLSALVALASAALVVAGAFRGRLLRYAAIALVLYAGVGVLARGLVPAAVQRLAVAPNELSRELPYLQNHITATRRAWGLDSVTVRDLSGEATLTMADIRANAPTITNVRLWERDLLKQTFGQLQEIRTYYDFVTVNDDRYTVDGVYRQVHLSARELNTASLPTRGFINDRLTFTHGMGVTVAPVNEVTAEGLPVLFVKDLPPVSTASIKLTRPQLYYGQLTNSYVFTGTKQKEFDYPSGDVNIYTSYAGTGGVPIGSFLRRLVYAWELGSLKILLSTDFTADTRILYRRNIAERARAALPFLDFDAEPYLVVTDAGRLEWILDGYTSSDAYPYAARSGDGTNYMRNSVKVVIDAYDGTVDAYVVDPHDPIVQTYERIFGGIFKPMSAMPADIRRHLRYPGALFRLQATLLATYHMVQPETFYHREDEWQMPATAAAQDAQKANPYMRHIILRLPGEKNPEFIYMIPFTPRGKDNLAAWMVARMDGDNYGKLVVYRFPRQSLVYGPRQISNRIEQDTDISRQLTLWDQRGSRVIRGELLVIPIEESLIYVQPIYLRAEGGTIPELKRVVVAAGNRVAMAETLEEGLQDVFGGGATSASANAAADTSAARPAAPASSLLQQAQDLYDRAIAAQRAGNWAEYGRAIDQLGAVIRQLRSRPK